jgi:hypothetical protein
MSAQCSSMHTIMGSVRSTFGRVARTSRSFVAAARLHPAGFAVPSTVIVAAVVFVTFVTAIVIRVIPPNLFGAGSPPITQPSASQLRHRPHPQPVLAGPPILWPSGGSPAEGRRHGSTGGRGQGPGSNGAGSPPLTFPITPGRTPTAGPNPASGSPATTPATVSVGVANSGSATQVIPAATAVAGATATTVVQAAQGVTGSTGTVTGTGNAVTGTVSAAAGTLGAAVTGTVSAVTGTVGAAAGTAAAVTNAGGSASSAPLSAPTSAPTVSLPVSVPGLVSSP